MNAELVTSSRSALPSAQLGLRQAVMSGSDIVAYKVRYPDGTQD